MSKGKNMNRHCTKCRPDNRLNCVHSILNERSTLQPYIIPRLKKDEIIDPKKPFTHCGVCHNDFNHDGQLIR